jgi:hypothetical protein
VGNCKGNTKSKFANSRYATALVFVDRDADEGGGGWSSTVLRLRSGGERHLIERFLIDDDQWHSWTIPAFLEHMRSNASSPATTRLWIGVEHHRELVHRGVVETQELERGW